MTRDEARVFAKVVQAYADGAEIQYRDSDGIWLDAEDPNFNGRAADCYRIKPDPREWWGVVDRDGDCMRPHRTIEQAENMRRQLDRDGGWPPYAIVHVREVTE